MKHTEVWFIQNKYGKYTPVTPRGWIALLVPVSVFILNLVFGVLILDLAVVSVRSIVQYLFMLFIFINSFFTVYVLNEFTSLTGEKYIKQ